MLLTIIVLLAIVALIRSLIKGTFWNGNLSSGFGGAAVGITVTLLFFLYPFLTTSGEKVLGVVFLAAIVTPIAAIIGAILFISIGSGMRKKTSIADNTSKSSIPQSTVPEFSDVTTHPDDSSLKPIAAEIGNEETYFGYRPGSIVERSAAYLTEKIIIIILLTVILGDDFYYLNIVWLDGFLVNPFIVVGKFLVAPALFSALFYPIWSGNLGHKIFGLKVISSVDGSDFNKAISGAGREFLKAVMSLIFIPVVWLMSDSNRQNLYDKRVNTYVVKRHEGMGKRGIMLRSALLVVMILMAIFQYRFYSLLHPGLNKNILGKWNSVSRNIEFSENGNVSINGSPIGYGEFETYTYTVNYLRYPFTLTLIPMYSIDPNSQLAEKIYFKAKYLNENEILLFNNDDRITLTRATSDKHYSEAKPARTDRFPVPENKISNDDLKQFWEDNIEAIINLDINKITSQTSIPFVVVNEGNGVGYQSSLFVNANYTDSLDMLKVIFPDKMLAGLRDMDYTNISQLQVGKEEIMLLIYFLGEIYPVEYREYGRNYTYPKFGLLFEKRNGKWMFCGQSNQWGYSRRLEQDKNETAEVLAAEQDEFVETKLKHDIQKLIQEVNLQAIIDLDKSKIISQTNFPLEGNWGQALGLKGEYTDWTKEDLTTDLSKIFVINYRSDFSDNTSLESKKPALIFENSDLYMGQIDETGVYYSAQNKINENHCCTRMTFKKVENDWKLVRLDLD